MITREEQVEQSVQDFVREGLVALGYTDDKVHVRDSFPTMDERGKAMDTSQLSLGFNFDDGGRHVEMGTDLTQRVYTLEFWVFGVSGGAGRNVANVVRNVLEDTPTIPLKDLSTDAVVDQLIVLSEQGVRVQRQVATDPQPWDRHVFTTTVKVEDIYYPGQVG